MKQFAKPDKGSAGLRPETIEHTEREKMDESGLYVISEYEPTERNQKRVVDEALETNKFSGSFGPKVTASYDESKSGQRAW